MKHGMDRFSLQRGQTMHLHAGQAAAIVIVSGKLSMAQPPRWLGEQVVTPAIVLMEGQCHLVEGIGITSLTALGTVEFVAFPRERRMPAWRSFPLRVGLALNMWRQRIVGRRA
jgi:hypothetical protein